MSLVQDVLGVLRAHSLNNTTTVEDLDAHALQLEHILVSVRRHRNSLLPIYQLPREILVIILQNVQDSKTDEYKYTAIRRLAKVSSYWFYTVLSTSSLWRTIRGTYPSQAPSIKSIIQRSRGASLNINLLEGDLPVLQNIMELIGPHAHRWRTFQMKSDDFASLRLLVKDKAGLHKLKQFKITGSHKAEVLPNWVKNNAPRLKTLFIIPFVLPFGAPVLSTVRELEFTPILEGFEFTPHQWQTFFCSSPQLELIVIQGTSEMKKRSVPRFRPFHALIPNLKKICLIELPSSTIGALISSICVNPNVFPEISIIGLSNETEGTKHLFPKSPQPQSLLCLIRSTTRLTAASEQHLLIMAGKGAREVTFVFRMAKIIPWAPLDVIFETLSRRGFPKLRELAAEGHPLFRSGAIIRSLSRFPKLTVFVILNPNLQLENSEYRNNLGDVLEALSLPSIKTKVKWLLPKLRELRITALNGFETLVPFAEARNGLRGFPGATKLPHRLREILLRHPDKAPNVGIIGPANRRRLNEILGP